MDIFYNNSYDPHTDWDHLNTLLASPDIPSVELALSILENTPQATRHATHALALISKFHQPQLQDRALVLLNSFLPHQQVALALQPLRVFDPVATHTTAWQEYARRIQIFEKTHHLYEPLILQNPNYIKAYLQITKIAVIEYQQWAIGFLYAEKVLQLLPDLTEARLFWVDAFVFHFFPLHLRTDQAPLILQHIDAIQSKIPHLAPLASYRRALIFNSVLPDPQKATTEFQKALDGGIQPPHKEKVQLQLAKLHVQLHNYQAAAPLLQQLERTEGPDKIAYELAITAWKGFNNPHAAINLLRRAATRDPHNHQICLDLAQLYTQVGDQRQANFYHQQALKY